MYYSTLEKLRFIYIWLSLKNFKLQTSQKISNAFRIIYEVMCNNHIFIYVCRYTIKFTGSLYETKKQTDFRKWNLNMDPVFPHGIIELLTLRKWGFLLHFCLLHDEIKKKYIWKRFWEWILKHKYLYESRCFQLEYFNYWHNEIRNCLHFSSVHDY